MFLLHVAYINRCYSLICQGDWGNSESRRALPNVGEISRPDHLCCAEPLDHQLCTHSKIHLFLYNIYPVNTDNDACIYLQTSSRCLHIHIPFLVSVFDIIWVLMLRPAWFYTSWVCPVEAHHSCLSLCSTSPCWPSMALARTIEIGRSPGLCPKYNRSCIQTMSEIGLPQEILNLSQTSS